MSIDNGLFSGTVSVPGGSIVIVSAELDKGAVERARALLAGIEKGAQKAIGSALKRATTSAEAFAAREIQQEYVIKSGDFKGHTTATRRVSVNEAAVEFHGAHIPIEQFDTAVSSAGVAARVKRGSAREVIDKAFRPDRPVHSGILQRETSRSYPVHGVMGPATPQMMSANETVKEAIGKKLKEVFEERLDHEVLAVLNGWR